MKLYYLLPILALFLLTSNANAYCYQETANISTSCGGLATGNYSYGTGWTLGGGPIVDGSYATFDTGNGGGTNVNYIEINYSIPNQADPISSLWQVKDSAELANLTGANASTTIFTSCFNTFSSTTNMLNLRVTTFGTPNRVLWMCNTPTTGYQTVWASNTPALGIIYEEGMFWSIGTISSIINASDELTQSPITLVNITAANLTYNTNYYNVPNMGAITNIPTGTTNLRFQTTTTTSDRYLQVNAPGQTLNPYLLSSSLATSMGFRAQDFAGNGVPSVTIQISKNINNQNAVITQQQTGGDGLIQVGLHGGDQYTLLATAPDGRSFTSTFQAATSAGQTYSFIMSSTITPPNFTGVFNHTLISIQPDNKLILQPTNLTLVVNNSDGALVWVAMNVYWNGTSNVFSTNQSTNYASIISYYANSSNMTGNLSIYVSILVNGFNATTLLYNYNFFNPNTIIPYSTEASLVNILPLIQGTSLLTRLFISVLITIVGTAAIASVLPIGAGIIALLIMGVMVLLTSVLSILQYAFILLVVIGIFMMRAR